MKRPINQYETITLLVKYYKDGTTHYCNPNNEEILFEKKFDRSPVVELEIREPAVRYEPHNFYHQPNNKEDK